MGIFGDIDANEVSDNPFYVAPDVYKCELTELTIVHTKNDKVGLSFKWTIREDDSEYNNMTVNDWINVYLSDDDAKDEVSLRRDRARLKSRLLAIGMTTEQMNNLVTEEDQINEDIADDFIGLEAIVTVTETIDKNDDTKIYTNVQKVELVED